MSETIMAAWIAGGAAVGGGLIGGLLSGAYQHLRDYWNRPILELDFQDDSSHRMEVADQNSDGKAQAYIYVRVRVRNTGRQVAKECAVFLADLREVHPSGETTRTAYAGSRQLAWPGYNFVRMSIPTGLDFYADILRISKDDPGWNISAQLFASEQILRSYSGTYRFHLVVTSDNAQPKRCAVDVSYAQDWHNLRAVAVRASHHA